MATSETWTKAFLAHLAAERGLSAHTVAAYRRDLGAFSGFLAPSGRDLIGASREDVAGFLSDQSRSGKTSSTIGRRLACLRTFYKFLVTERIVGESPARDVPLPRQGDRLPKRLEPIDLENLLEKGPQGPQELRDRAILETFYATGLRASELARLSVRDVNLEFGFVRARGKGGKERVVPLGKTAARVVADYLQETEAARKEKGASGEPLFLSRRGGALGRVALWRIVKRACQRAGCPASVSPHTLRHTFASDLVANGADLRSVQEMLGHASVATTQVYTHVESAWLRKEHTKFHPRS